MQDSYSSRLCGSLHRLAIRLGVAVIISQSVAESVGAQQAKLDQLTRTASDLAALMDAEEGKSLFCKDYIGKTVAPANFDALAQKMVGAGDKKEFETTAQYDARRRAAAARLPAGPTVLILPTDRDYLRYDADGLSMMVSAGAFGAGAFGSDDLGDMSAFATVAANDLTGGIAIPYSQSDKVLKTYVLRNGLGITFRASDVDRHTRALYLDTPSLFSFAKDKESLVMAFEAPLAAGPRLKQIVRVALILEPRAPYVLSGSSSTVGATSRDPFHYELRSSVLIAHGRCGVALDAQYRVLASVDVK